MQIEKLVLRNFKQFKDQSITFPTGLVGFIGRNGAGKSTIFEGIYNCLYGKYEGDKNRIKNDLADSKDHIFLELSFEDKGKSYRVQREYRGKSLTTKAELFCEDKSLISGSTEVTKFITKLLKIDSRNFKNSFFSQQKDVTALLGMGKSERQVQLRKMLGLSKLDTLESRIKEDEKSLRSMKNAKSDLILSTEQLIELTKDADTHRSEEERLAKEHSTFLAKLSKAVKDYEDSKISLENLEIIKDQHEKLNSRFEVTETKSEGNKRRISETDEEIEDLKAKKKELPSLKTKKIRYDELEKEIKNLLEKKSLFTQKEALEKEIEKLKKQLIIKKNNLEEEKKQAVSFTGTEKKIRNQEKLRESKQETLEALNDTRDQINNRLASAKNDLLAIEEKKEEIKKLGRTSPCPECERPLHEHYDALIHKYDENSSTIKKSIVLIREELGVADGKIKEKLAEQKEIDKELRKLEGDQSKFEKITENIENLEDELKELTSDLAENETEYKPLKKIQYNVKELDKVQNEREKLEDDSETYISYEKEVRKLPAKLESLKELKEKSAEYDELLKSIKADITSLHFDNKKYNEAKETRDKKEKIKDEFSENEREIKEELNNHKHEIRSIEKKITDNEKIQEEVKLIDADINLHQRLASYVNEFKNKLTSRELPAISEEASRLFSEITKSRYNDLRITDDYEFNVNREGFVVPLDTLSGGEKDLAGLCLRVAISKRIASLAGRKNMGFLALDEVFGSQDEQRREELLKSLHPISKDFKQIFVISHNEDVHSAFGTNLVIKKKGNYSKVEVIS